MKSDNNYIPTVSYPHGCSRLLYIPTVVIKNLSFAGGVVIETISGENNVRYIEPSIKESMNGYNGKSRNIHIK